MSLIVNGSSPLVLLANIKKDIAAGHITTWEEVLYGNESYFTHITPDRQWYRKAFFLPAINGSVLTFGLIKAQNIEMTKVIAAVYHGRFSEMLCAHFVDSFTSVLIQKPLSLN